MLLVMLVASLSVCPAREIHLLLHQSYGSVMGALAALRTCPGTHLRKLLLSLALSRRHPNRLRCWSIPQALPQGSIASVDFFPLAFIVFTSFY